MPQWIEVAAQMLDRNLSRRMAPLQYDAVWRPQGKMTMSGDMPLVLLDVVNSVLGEESRVEYDEKCLNLEVCNFEIWKRACGLWKQTGWIYQRVAFAATCRAEAESQSTAAQTMAMTLEQPLVVEGAPVEEVAEDTAMPVTPDQSDEYAAEIMPNAAQKIQLES